MNRMIEAWHASRGWRTLAASAAIAVVGVLQATDWHTLIPPDRVGPVMVGIGVVMALLRMVTDGPVGRK